jgi:signal transduction histidine kinase
VERQATLLVENAELNERVRRAAARTTELNERFLRRISAELHDGPAQDLGLALLRLDHVLERVVRGPAATAGQTATADTPESSSEPEATSVSDDERDLEAIDGSLRRAMQEIRSISGGLGVPHLEDWTLTETVSRVVSNHERHTGTKVTVVGDYSGEQVPLPVKITVYRLVQEALRNAYRHAEGSGQRVVVRSAGDTLQVEVADEGAGFDPAVARGSGERLGLVGMRERVESIGGEFHIESAPGHGTRIRAELPLTTQEEGT